MKKIKTKEKSLKTNYKGLFIDQQKRRRFEARKIRALTRDPDPRSVLGSANPVSFQMVDFIPSVGLSDLFVDRPIGPLDQVLLTLHDCWLLIWSGPFDHLTRSSQPSDLITCWFLVLLNTKKSRKNPEKSR